MKRIWIVLAMIMILGLTATGQILGRGDVTTNLPDDNTLSAALPFLIPVQNISCQAFPSAVTFRIYAKEAAVSAEWQETQTVNSSQSYNKIVLLGVTTNGLPREAFAGRLALWLGIQCAGELEQGRLMMSSAPYAIKSLDSENLGGRPAADYALVGTSDVSALTSNLNNETSRAQMVEANMVADITAETTARQSAIATLQNSNQTTMMSIAQATTYTANTTADDGTPLVVNAVLNPFVASGRDALLGVTNHPMGNALEGHAISTSGEAWGVYGQSDSSNGTGIAGEANDLNGAEISYGAQGFAHSSKGIGVYGSSDWTNSDGSMIGVMGQVNHPSAVAGVFDNSADGTVISGRSNGNETFNVASNGTVTARFYQGDGSQLTGLASANQIATLNAALASIQTQVAMLQASNDALLAKIAAMQTASSVPVVTSQISMANASATVPSRASRVQRPVGN